jgi:uncharacterized protein YcaQ
VSVAGARSHAIVLMSRLDGFPAPLGEELLRPGEPLFEFWGHEVSWMPIEMYPAFGFRRNRAHPWWGDILSEHADLARDILARITNEGPLRSADLEGKDHGAWWAHRPAKKVIVALWSSGVLAIRERNRFQRTYDLTERVIPAEWRDRDLSRKAAFEALFLKALDGHGWAGTGTLAMTWRLRNMKPEIQATLQALVDRGEIEPCGVVLESGRTLPGWIRPEDLELAARLSSIRFRPDRAVLLSPFDPVLWDRPRVSHLFGFDALLEIFKPAPQRVYGYYSLPVLAGERLVARVDLKAERSRGRLKVLSRHFESGSLRSASAADREAVRVAVERYAVGVGLEV